MFLELRDVNLISKNNILYCFKNDQYENYLITPPSLPKVKLEYKKKYKIKEAFLYSNRWDHNFRHFMIETFCGIHKFMNSTKIIIKDKCPKHTLQVLKILGLEKNVIRIKNNECYNINKLHITINKRIKFNLHINNFLKKFINKCHEMSTIKLDNKNLYLSREKYDKYRNNNPPKRWVTNFNEIKDIFTNFKTIETHNMELWDQVSIINQANNIILLIGAGADNYLFVNKSCKFIVLYPNFCNVWSRFLSEYKRGTYIGINCGRRNNNIDYNKLKSSDPCDGPWICFKKKIIQKLNVLNLL